MTGMDGNDWIWLEMTGMAGNGWKQLKITIGFGPWSLILFDLKMMMNKMQWPF